jgi:hypothetical protein
MSAPDASVLLDAQDTLQKVRELIDGLRMAEESLLSHNRDKANSIVYLSDLARNRLDKAEHEIDRVLKGLKPTRAAS